MRSHARAILIAAEIDESICKVTQRCMTQCPVFSVGDIREASHAFHFGAEPYLVGLRMADMLNSDMDHAHIAITMTNRFRKGVEGFLSAFGGTSTLLSFSDCFHSASAAIFAHTLSAAHEQHPFDAIVCMDGFADRLCLTMQKLKLDIPCCGLEHAPRIDPYLTSGILRGTLCNNLEATAHSVIDAIQRYLQDGRLPRERNTHIEPILLCGDAK